jgi:NAD(P)-dependent dehydrogenase (short-subunit alcohol dehydrogenase family)
MFRLDGKVAVVTGAGSGIGASIAQLFARQGARVAILERDIPAARAIETAIESAGGEADSFPCDVSKANEVDAAFDEVSLRFHRVDVLVNNAGIAHVGDIESTTEADLDRVYEVNVKGTYLCTRAGVRAMLRGGGGVILNLASIASLIGIEDRFAYTMSKGAVLTMTRSIAVDYMDRNIRCNCVCPARVHTPFVDGYLKANYPGREAEMFQKLSEYQPMGRMARPEEVAALALYLCSEEASFITGQAFPIDGGVLVQ